MAVRRAKKATIPRRFDTRLEFLEPVHLNIDPFHLRMCMEASTSLATSAGAVALLLPRAPTKPPPALPASSLQPKLVRRPPRGLVREHPRLVGAADPPLSNDARNSRGSTRGDSRSASDGPALGRVEEGLEEGESWREVSGESSSEVHGHGHGAFTESRHHRRHLVGQLGGVVGRIGRGLGHAQRTVLREAAGLLPSGRRRQSAESNEPLREESSLNGGRGSLGGSLGSDWGDVEEADQFTRTVAVVCREVSVSLLSSLNHSPTAVAKLQIISPSTHAFSLAAESTPATGMRASIDLQLQATHTHTHTRICTHTYTYVYSAAPSRRPATHIYICLCVQASHFNRSVGLWEPLLEPAQVSLELRQPPRPELGAAAAAVEARISMISRLELVLSDDAVSALCAVSARVQEAFTAPLPLLLAQRTRSPHAIVNETGVDLFYWQAGDVPRGITRHRVGKPAEAKRILPGQEEPLELWSSDAVQQKAQLIQIEIEGAAPLAPAPLTTAHAVDAARVGSRLVPLRPAAAPGMPRGGDEMDALVCSVELKDGGATTLLRLGTLVQVYILYIPPHIDTRSSRRAPPPAPPPAPPTRPAHTPTPRLGASHPSPRRLSRCATAAGCRSSYSCVSRTFPKAPHAARPNRTPTTPR